jgi:aspartyl-tRNA(Asn)/glutamyl-tRNA(Gln) amidotransferase subunit B
VADYFEAVARASGNARAAASFVLNDLVRAQREAQRDESDIGLAPDLLAELIRLVDRGTVSHSVARQELFPEVYRSGVSPRRLVEERGLAQVSDDAALLDLVRQVLADHPGQLAQYRAGKTGLLGFFVGQVVRRSGGRANPRLARELLQKEIG